MIETAIDQVQDSNEDQIRMSNLERFESITKHGNDKPVKNERRRSTSLNRTNNRYADVKPKINTRVLSGTHRMNDSMNDEDDNYNNNSQDLNNSYSIR
jgi:hypothetical protein